VTFFMRRASENTILALFSLQVLPTVKQADREGRVWDFF